MHCTALNIRTAIEENDFPKGRAENLLEIAELLEEAEQLVNFYAEKCDILSHLLLTYKKEGDVSRKHIESLLTQ